MTLTRIFRIKTTIELQRVSKQKNTFYTLHVVAQVKRK